MFSSLWCECRLESFKCKKCVRPVTCDTSHPYCHCNISVIHSYHSFIHHQINVAACCCLVVFVLEGWRSVSYTVIYLTKFVKIWHTAYLNLFGVKFSQSVIKTQTVFELPSLWGYKSSIKFFILSKCVILPAGNCVINLKGFCKCLFKVSVVINTHFSQILK